MSDCFDHFADACDDFWFGRTYNGEPDNWIYTPKRKTCKFCEQPNLNWKETEHGWRLVNTLGKIHLCKEYENTKPTE